MTKKIFLGMSAMAMLFATSCKDDFAESFVGDQATVEFSISTPEIGTRAYSDGMTATKLQYAVYDAAGTELTALRGQGEKMVTLTNGKANVKLELTTGETYQVIFWADAYGNAENAPYKVDFANKTMTANYTGAVSNDENRDAFYVCKPITVNGAQTENIELKRPFAQLNIGTSDYTEAKNAGYEPKKSMVTVKSLGNTLNLWDGTVSGNPEEVIVNFDYADIAKGEAFPVDGYDYLAMNYLLVGADQEVVDIEFGYTETDVTAAKTRTVGSVPVQRNYRTNIYGKLLTSTVDVNVEIVPDFNEPAHGLAALQNAALNGGEVTLTENITLTTPLEVYGKMTINLNGHTITGPNAARDADGNRIHVIVNNGKLTVNGGTISSVAENGGSAILNNGALVLNDMTINGAPIVDGAWPSYAINNYGNLTVNGATINSYHGAIAVGGDGVAVVNDATVDVGQSTQTKQTSWALYTFENGQLTVNGGTFKNTKNEQNKVYGGGYICATSTKETLINGGTFDKTEGDNNGSGIYYNCTNLVIKGGTFDTNPSKHVAEGYTAIEKDGKWTVVEGTVTTNPDELVAAVAKGGKILLGADITLTEAIKLEGVTATIDLNGKTITSEKDDAFVANDGANLTISGNGKVESNGAPIRAIGGKVIVKGGEFTQTGAWNTNVSTYRYSVDSREGGEIIIKGGTFKTNNGMINVSANSSVVVEGGNFEFYNNTGGTRHFAYVSGNLTINDGEFKGAADASAGGCFFCGAAATGKVTVNGGKFTSLWTTGTVNKIFEAYSSGSSIYVTGGLFNTNGGIASFVEENTDAATKDAYPYKAK